MPSLFSVIQKSLKDAEKEKCIFNSQLFKDVVDGALLTSKNKKQTKPSDGVVIEVIEKYIKINETSIEEEGPKWPHIIDDLKEEIEILKTFLPKPLNEDRVIEIAQSEVSLLHKIIEATTSARAVAVCMDHFREIEGTYVDGVVIANAVIAIRNY